MTGIDDHSRFCVSAKLVDRAAARPVCDALIEAMRRHGVFEAILSDNGKNGAQPSSARARARRCRATNEESGGTPWKSCNQAHRIG